MPSHYGKKKPTRMPKPMGKPRKDLSKDQKALMKEHKVHHTPKHMREMRKLMKAGYCFSQSHALTMKSVGK